MLKKEIGKRIKDLRIMTNEYSQNQFATMLGWDKSYLCKIEAGKQNITIENLNAICNGLGITLKQFFVPFDKSFDDKKSN